MTLKIWKIGFSLVRQFNSVGVFLVAVKQTAYIYKAPRSYRAQLEITNDAFKDCRKSLTNWWRSPTGKNYEQGLSAKLRMLARAADSVPTAIAFRQFVLPDHSAPSPSWQLFLPVCTCKPLTICSEGRRGAPGRSS
jgi:hypothetical protein